MKKLTFCLAILCVAGLIACKRSDPKSQVEAAIQQHLKQNAHLLPDSFSTHFESVKVSGPTAQVLVKYESKNVRNLSVQVSYGLRNIGGHWQVVSSSSAGGQVSNPANPHQAPPLDQTPAPEPVPSH